MRSLLLPVGTAALLGACAVAAQDHPTCAIDKKCPESAPCCSQYGQCGVGAYCLGGCDPRMSFSIDSCVPAPVCRDRKMPMNSLDGIADISKYLGDPTKAEWVSQGEPVINDGTLLLTMPPGSVGTVLASTVYMWYGTVKARLKTSRGAGVVTAFILFSDVKDEIDYEWVGTQMDTTQTNYYFQGIPDYTNSGNITLSNTFGNWHEYEIRWTPDDIKWLVDGQVGRVQKKADTWNATTQSWDFPQTPARVQLSLWPGGLASNAPGTVEWAGGPIDWENHPDIKNVGYYYATFGEITMECYRSDRAPGTNKGRGYWYDDISALNNTVVDGDKPTVLASFTATGLDMDAGKSKDPKKPAPSITPAQIPGGDSGNPGSDPATEEDAPDSPADPADPADPGANPKSGCDPDSFTQSCGGPNGGGGDGNAGSSVGRPALVAGAFAVVVALGGLFAL